MHQPELLILDEPTMGLDPLVQQEFYKMVREVKRDGRTVFLSSHIMPEVERICDRVGIIRKGRMVAVEKISDLKERRLRHMLLKKIFADRKHVELRDMAEPPLSDEHPLDIFEIGELERIVECCNRIRMC